jgi:hypothetical protein
VSNPILEELVQVVREDTALDVELIESGGCYHVKINDGRKAPAVCGPLDHAQAWWCLIGVMCGRNFGPTLNTEKRREEKRRRDRLEGALEAAKPKTPLPVDND